MRELISDLALIEDVIRATPVLLTVDGRVSNNPDLIALKAAEQRIVSELRHRALPSSVTWGRLA